MAQLISVKLSRFDGSPWGFRLQGGKDFGTPLIVQKVNSGSPAEAAGLKAGDAVIRVNTTDMYNLRHKDAQDVIVKAGNNFEITVQRGGSTWKPHVTPATTSLPSPMHTAPAGNITPVTKTSLAAKKQDGPLIGSGHNFSPKPFLNGTGDGPIKSIVNKQYNSPVGIYSEETIAETLSAQAEVLAGGVLGVNFKKNEKNYNAENSEVFKMVQEADKEPKTPEPAEPNVVSGVITPSSPALAGLRPVQAPETKPQTPSTPQTSLPPGQNICAECERLIVTEFYSSVSHAVGGRATSPRSPTPLFHAMGGGGSAPADSRHFVWMDESYGKNREPQPQKQESSAGSGSSTPGGVVCSNCDRVIVGVFVRIKEKNLHVECFKCSTCGTSLKNVGYYNINNKLYCDIHAKLVARQNAPAGLVPLTIPPGGKAPASTISAALASAPLSPPLSNHGSPQPFSACNRTSPESGFQHTWRSTSNTNGCIKNGECNGESKTFTSTITIQTGGTE
ncbi:PREDICTED: PDZ and LIM domain protein Zasp-like, partial [Atta colombica]|uniref:PDZ and LIM domain protein Zasp-like n=1 Tax=Atta colombica TaxID=520822 RepID=UPI00084C3BFE